MSPMKIPASYIDTGVGPNQIPQRGVDGGIPGVPTIFTRSMVDEVAEVVRRTVPSGFLKGGRVTGSPAGGYHKVVFDGNAEVVVDGYRLKIEQGDIQVQLSLPPIAGSREDLVFMELWFDYAGSYARTLNWRLRTVADVDFDTYPDGLSDPKVTAYTGVGIDTHAPFVRMHPNFDRQSDPGLYIAAVPHVFNDILAEKGNDDAAYKITYALPLARVHRLNTTAYDPETNPSGAPFSTAGVPSNRPDGLFNDLIDLTRQIRPLRNAVSFDRDWNAVFKTALVDWLKGRMRPHGVAEETMVALNDAGQQSYFGDPAALSSFVVAANLIRQSHMASDNDANGIPDGWAAYQTGSAVGFYTFGNPGAVLERTGDDESSDFGIQQSISGFGTSRYLVRLGYVLAWTSSDTQLIVEGVRADNSVAFQKIENLSGKPTGTNLEAEVSVDNEIADEALTVRVYLTEGAGRVTVMYVDVRPETQMVPVMPMTDGSVFRIARSATLTALGASFVLADVQAYDGTTGGEIATTATLDGSDLVVQLGEIPTHRDVRVRVPVSYPAGSGFTRTFTQIDRAWDADGFAGLAYAQQTTSPMTAPQLGFPVPVGESFETANPLLSRSGLVMTVTLLGNGTTMYTIPGTYHGRRVLMPVSVTVGGNAQVLENLTRNEDGTLTFTIANAVSVANSVPFTVGLSLEAPIVLWDDRVNGVQAVYRAQLVKTTVAAPTDVVNVSVLGLATDLVESTACVGVFVNGTGVTLTEGVLVSNKDTPVLTLGLPSTVQPGDLIEAVVLVQGEVPVNSNLSVAYSAGVPADTREALPAPVVVLAGPVMIAHTKGTGAVNATSDFGPRPFVRDAALDGRLIALEGRTPMVSALLDIPLLVNTWDAEPVYEGRTFIFDEEVGLPGTFEGVPLSADVPHHTLVAMLVHLRGRICLMVVESARTDDRNLVDGSNPVRIFELGDRPLTLA